MKYNHDVSYFKKYDNETISHSETFTLTGSDTLSSAVVTCIDSLGVDNNSLIDNISVSSPVVTFDFTGGNANETYQIKITGTTSNSYVYVKYVMCEVYGTITLNANIGDPNANSYVTVSEANTYIRNKYGHNSLWDSLSLEGKKRVLIEATNDIEVYNYIGEKYYDTQALEFPRDDHDVISGDCATPFSINSFSNSNFTSDTYGAEKSYNDYWKYGTVHITVGTPLYDIRSINTSDITTNVITTFTDFSATPTANTDFIAFTPIDKYIKYAQIEQALFILDTKNSTATNKYSGIADKVKMDDVEILFKKGASMNKRVALKAKKMLSRWIEKSIKLRRA